MIISYMIQSALIGPFFLYMVTHNYTSISFDFVTIHVYDYPGKRAGWLWEF